MKKTICFLTALILIIPIVLSGCGGNDPLPIPDISDYNSEAFIPVSEPERSDAEGESNAGEVTGGFTVRDRKYTFDGSDLVVLNVENGTNRNYLVKLHGKYLDENGNVLKEETQEFKGFAAGWKNYFLFRPKITFDTFTYELETEEFTGECIAAKMEISKMKPEFRWIKYNGWYSGIDYDCDGWTLNVNNLYFQNMGEMPMRITFHMIVIGNDGEIYEINDIPKGDNYLNHPEYMLIPITATYPPQELHTKGFIGELIPGAKSEKVIPDKLKDGNITTLVAVVGAEWDPEWTNNG